MQSIADKTVHGEELTVVNPDHHKHTLIWMHGLDQPKQMHMANVREALGAHERQTKQIFPRAPIRNVAMLNKKASSWFNLKVPRSSDNFMVPFDQAFSAEQVEDSFHNVLLPIIIRESQIVRQQGGKLIVAGFSQGCGMSIHSLYSRPDLIDGAIGIAGYFFPITKYDPTVNKPLYVIHGKNDDLRPWQDTKVTYYGRVSAGTQITLVQGMGHNMVEGTDKAFAAYIEKILGAKPKL